MKDIKEIFGQRVRYHRKSKNLSQEQLAEICELHPTYIGQLERGEKNASLETIMRVSAGLDISPAILFENITAKSEETTSRKVYELIAVLPENKQAVMYEAIKKICEII